MKFKRSFRNGFIYFARLSKERSFRNLNFRFIILFGCVCLGTLVEFCLLHVLTQSKYPVLFTSFYFVATFFCSPLQAGYSDNDRRKLVLVFATLACSFGFGYSYFLSGTVSNLSAWILVLIVGVFGNLIETAWAAMGDERIGASNARCMFAISNSFMALAALLFSAVKLYKLQFLARLISPDKFVIKNFSSAYLLYALIGLALSGVIIWKYQNRHDADPISSPSSKHTFLSLVVHHLRELLKSKKFCFGILVFFLWEIAFYLIHQVGIDLKIKPFNYVTRWMAGGYILGTFLLPFFQNASEKLLINIGHCISIVSLVVGLLLSIFTEIPLRPLVNTCFAFFSVGAAFLSPTLFSSVSAKVPIHRQGVLFGSYGSADTLATAAALLLGELSLSLINKLNKLFNLHFINPVVMMGLSLMIMMGAIFTYGKFFKFKGR